MVGPDHVMGLAIGNELERRVVLIVTPCPHISRGQSSVPNATIFLARRTTL